MKSCMDDRVSNTSMHGPWCMRLAWMLFILNVLNLAWFIFYRYQRLAFNSDSATKVLLAKEIVESGSYFPKDWVFVNQDLWTLSWHTLIIPLLKIFPAGYTVHAIAGLTATFLILLSIWLVLSETDLSGALKILLLAIFASGISLTFTENLFGQVSYGSIFLHYCVLVYASWRILNNPVLRARISSMVLLILFVSITWANPLRTIIYYSAPLCFSVIAYVAIAVSERNLQSKYSAVIKLLAICLVGTVIGFVLHKLTMTFVQTSDAVSQLRWIPMSAMFEKIPKIIRSLMFILGGEPHAGRSVYTVSAIYDAYRMVVAVCFIGLVPVSIVRLFSGTGNNILKFMTVFGTASFGIVCFLMLTTNIYNGRYLLPSVALIIVTVFAQRFDFRTYPIFNFFRALVIAGFLTNVLVMNTSYWATYHASEAHHDDYQNYDKPFELMEFLRENDLAYGYATYWNASVITVLSDHRTVVVQVYLKNGLPNRFNWLSSDRWYRPSNYVGDSFLLLTEDEAKAVDWPTLSSRYGLSPYRTLSYKNYRVYVFAENIANKLPF